MSFDPILLDYQRLKGVLEMKQDILIIGGYGKVGRHVVMELIKICPEKIIIAGRDLNKANAFVQETGYPLRTMQIDMNKSEQFEQQLKVVHTVLMCVEAKDTTFVKFCIDNGVNYADISASNKILTHTKQLEEKAIQNNVSCILGVGIAPGLSSLLAKKVAAEMEIVNKINFTLMLGLGEQHGPDGVRWFLDNLRTDFEVRGVLVKPFMKRHKAHFSQPLGVRNAYSFNLADGQIISETLNAPVDTYYCYDSKFITYLLHMLKKGRLLNALKKPKIFDTSLKMFSSDKLSKSTKLSDTIGLHIAATGLDKGKQVTHYGSIVGNNSSTVTGKVATHTALALTQNSYPTGVHYLSEVANLDDVIAALDEELSIELSTY